MDTSEIERILEEHFRIYWKEVSNGVLRLYVTPKETFNPEELKKQMLPFSTKYKISMRSHYGELVVEIQEIGEEKENVILPLILFLATIVTTTLVGSTFYPEFNILGGFQFSMAIMFVLGSHEMGHYLAARRWGMKTSFPYFIPFPTIIGTLGAVIKHRGPIPNRKALFDVGCSGPIIGVVASIIVALIGMNMEFRAGGEAVIMLGTPLLFDFLARLTGFDGGVMHPIAFAGWVGMFITSLNLIPVGQLDGGHVMRALIGKRANAISRAMPFFLLALGSFVNYFLNVTSSVWFFWGLISFFFAMQGHPDPIEDEPLDRRRVIGGIIVFIIALLTFTPVPFQIPQNL